ncbi:type IV pilus assembly protein PilV [Geoalkalibacter ferrihydriticus]|uniref:Type IV pilus modification protein PilV n=2 Tax=Geoalkalibacter ferrihydriticus TaxID=392333 RepID=A0A0C2HER6_9BACT|nr:prepilin-type N-terminal cleavage/methylation domain-containing protein [Geoalkalibacter ferrihydriticus]KIH75446.1 hypothetical protein GFER_16850 [Geoalkalibacter ferrihydriticus DSM 17813]SDM93736.1 type IV pilus assembly protein PilV [Geoalkalibacter ferrihydriticus]
MIPIKSRQGFTLLEVLIALSLFAVGLLAVATLQGTGLRAAGAAELRTQGRAAAKSLAEHLLALPYDHDDLQDVNGNGRAGLDDRDDEDAPADHVWEPPGIARIRVFWNIAEDDPVPGLKTVRILALWQAQGGKQSTTLEFIRAAGF